MLCAALNPYSGRDFMEFWGVFFKRVILFIQGALSFQDLVSDEIQIVVLILLGLSLSFLGTFLVLKQMTMLANALSHTILLGIVLAYLFLTSFLQLEVSFSFSSIKILMLAALFTGLLTTLFTEWLKEKMHISEDASIGLVFTSFFAVGIVLVTLYTKNVHIGTEAVMGNIDALHVNDIKTVAYLAVGNFIVFTTFFKAFKTAAFDPLFAKTIGWPVQCLNYSLMVLAAAGAIAAFRAVGVLLFLAFLVGPVLISRLLTHCLKKMVMLNFIISSLCSMMAVAYARHCLSVYKIPLSTAGLVVTFVAVLYLGLILVFCNERYLRLFFKNKAKL